MRRHFVPRLKMSRVHSIVTSSFYQPFHVFNSVKELSLAIVIDPREMSIRLLTDA